MQGRTVRVEWRSWGVWHVTPERPENVFTKLADTVHLRAADGGPAYPREADIEIRVYAGAELWVWRQLEAEAMLRQWARERGMMNR